MNLQSVIFFTFAVFTGTLGKNLRIFGGQNADIEEYPYSVSLGLISSATHFCGGTIISNWHILTAAHCANKHHHFLIKAYLGTTKLQITAETGYRIERVKVHPEFTGQRTVKSYYSNDIAVMTLQRCIRFNQYQNKINLPVKNIQVDEAATIVGWGMTEDVKTDYSEILQKASVKVLSNKDCEEYLPFKLRDKQVCVLEKKGIGACYGDSGAPLVRNGVLIGIGSFVRPCATGIPDVYTRVYPYLSFIKSELSNIKTFC